MAPLFVGLVVESLNLVPGVNSELVGAPDPPFASYFSVRVLLSSLHLTRIKVADCSELDVSRNFHMLSYENDASVNEAVSETTS